MLKPVAPIEEELRAVRGIDFGVLLRDQRRKDILKIFVEHPLAMTLDDVAVRLSRHTREGDMQLFRSLEGMRQLGVFTVSGNGSPSYALSSAMSVELQKYLSPRVSAPDMASLPKAVRKLLDSGHMRVVRAALQAIGEGDERAVAMQILHKKMVPPPVPKHRLDRLTVTTRTALYTLVQHGFAAVLVRHNGEAARFRHLDTSAEKDDEPAVTDTAPLTSADLRAAKPSVEELENDTIETACLEVLQEGPLLKDALYAKVRLALGVPAQDARINKALAKLLTAKAVMRRKNVLSLPDADDDDLPVAVPLHMGDAPMEEIAKRVEGYLKEWRANLPDEDEPFEEGPRTADVRLDDYIAACRCADEAELKKLLQQQALDPYDLFVAHQEYCDHILALQQKRLAGAQAMKAFRARHAFTVKQAQNLAALFADDERHAEVAKKTQRTVAALHPDVVRRYLKKALPVQYRERLL